MKELTVNSILNVIHGTLYCGDRNIVIRDVKKRIKKADWDLKNTIIFDTKQRRVKWKKYPNWKSVVIVTNRPRVIKRVSSSSTIIFVENVGKSYWDFIDYYRGLFNIPVIGITGTCGKTTTKEMLSWILSETKKVHKTFKNRNSPFRILKYLLSLEEDAEAAVIEMAAANKGNLKNTCRYFKPNIGIITSIGIDHLDKFPKLDDYIKEKSTIITSVGENGTILLNYDDMNIRKIKLNKFKGKVIYFGLNEGADFFADELEFKEEGTNFCLNTSGKQYEVFIPGVGEHNVYNAIAAIVAAFELGIPIEKSIKRLKDFVHIERHFEIQKGMRESILIDDTWSSNPTSIYAALKAINELYPKKKKIAVLGEMHYLGTGSRKAHLLVGELITRSKIDIAITIGNGARPIQEKALQMGMQPENIIHVQTLKEAEVKLRELLDSDTVVLLKTSIKDSYGTLINSLKTNH
ncbi:UDP-N-acetylmuramoyl-tripeptide--D-alanyl-D-alanine ligase [Bacillus suaedaesalsae]|uniref:UDP-N-acetylmuramoyl-tripeptide--D-alanyl-D-alanine ligase n=1 Tax=Bacillus suaedaesalsae TaxID=2810349 RepID=A0ABS2DIE9_9BACI|nr:UDP-N-acetylmuramoyl-tripeptide--D-alanyl-D-alanine ligase [Bacillus suaedaesalsae]MBM6618228.1 UDP-N-acetylmuramoyl-tripeptide--D-alanyl-D-alanine ligase [Bacillus suaedaesalsae]